MLDIFSSATVHSGLIRLTRWASTLAVIASLCLTSELIAQLSSPALNDSIGRPPRIVLLLSGGGSRGISQIGVLKVLEREKIPFTAIVGTSIGAVIGGLYSAGYSASELDSIITSTDWADLLAINNSTPRSDLFIDQKESQDRSLLTLRFNDFQFVVPEAVSSNNRFTSFLQELFWKASTYPNLTFDQLKIPFRCVATDLVQGKAVSLSSGDIVSAIRASATLPLRYTPLRRDSLILVDGGILANIPTEQALEFKPDIIIAVNTTSPLRKRDELDKPWAVADQVVSLLMEKLKSVARLSVDVMIEPMLGQRDNQDFSNLDSLIILGETAAEKEVQKLRNLINSFSRAPFEIGDTQEVSDDSVPVFDLQEDSLLCFQSSKSKSYFAACRRAGIMFPRIIGTNNVSLAEQSTLICEKKTTVDGINITGLVNTNEMTVRRELLIHPDRRLMVDDVKSSWQNLMATDLYNEVSFQFRRTPSDSLILDVSVKERPMQTLNLGTRIDNERNAQLSFEFLHANLFNSGLNSGLRLSGGRRNVLGLLHFSALRLFNSYWTASLKLYAEDRNIYTYSLSKVTPLSQEWSRHEGYNEVRHGLRASFGRQVGKSGLVVAEIRYENQKYFGVAQNGDLIEYQQIFNAKATARFDTRNRFDFPERGSFLSSSFETPLFPLSATVPFSKIEVHAEQHLSWLGLTAMPKVWIGFSDATAPLPEFFSIGGNDVLYGMREEQERGRQVVVGSFELRYKLPIKIFFDTYFSARYDIGAIWEVPERVKFSTLKNGIGASIALDTPLGPARFSVGQRFFFVEPRAEVVTNPLLFYFSLGVKL